MSANRWPWRNFKGLAVCAGDDWENKDDLRTPHKEAWYTDSSFLFHVYVVSNFFYVYSGTAKGIYLFRSNRLYEQNILYEACFWEIVHYEQFCSFNSWIISTYRIPNFLWWVITLVLGALLSQFLLFLLLEAMNGVAMLAGCMRYAWLFLQVSAYFTDNLQREVDLQWKLD